MTELLDVHAHHRVLEVGTVILGFRLVMISTCVLYAIAVAAYYLFLRGTPRLSS
jgi:protein-L-isoaspartate O-methyltransferase